jgi:serine protease AprX
MATAVVSGAVALLLQRQPGLAPDQVKAILTGTAAPFGQTSGTPTNAAQIGSGLVDAYAAAASGSRGSANRGLRPADAAARTLYPALYGQPLVWRPNSILSGVVSWSNLAWDNLAWDNLAWDNIAWDNLAWDNLAWDNIAWDSSKWSNLAWDNLAWDSQQFD